MSMYYFITFPLLWRSHGSKSVLDIIMESYAYAMHIGKLIHCPCQVGSGTHFSPTNLGMVSRGTSIKSQIK